MFDATNLCFTGMCEVPVNIDNHTFENLSINIVQISQNKGLFHLLSCMNLNSLLYGNFAETRIDVIGPPHLNNASSLKRLDMYFLNPSKVRLKVLNNTFDKLRALEHLDLSGNMIESLPQDIFQHNYNLIYLDLSGNCLYLTVLDPIYVPEQIK